MSHRPASFPESPEGLSSAHITMNIVLFFFKGGEGITANNYSHWGLHEKNGDEFEFEVVFTLNPHHAFTLWFNFSSSNRNLSSNINK